MQVSFSNTHTPTHIKICVWGLKFHTLKIDSNSNPTPPWLSFTNFGFSLSLFSSSAPLFSKVCTFCSRSRSNSPSVNASLHVTIIVNSDWINVKRSYFYFWADPITPFSASPFQLWSAFGLLIFVCFDLCWNHVLCSSLIAYYQSLLWC